jgi:hypothetical protein
MLLYSLRPRATCIIFLLHAILERYSRTKKTSFLSRNGFFLTGVTCMVSEGVVNLLCVTLLINQAAPVGSTYCNRDPDLSVYNAMRVYAIGFIASTMLFTGALILPLWWCAWRKWKSGSRTTDLRRLNLFLWILWVFTVSTFVFSWLFWRALLNGSSEDQYCVEEGSLIDAVYLTLPVLLGVWRHGVT